MVCCEEARQGSNLLHSFVDADGDASGISEVWCISTLATREIVSRCCRMVRERYRTGTIAYSSTSTLSWGRSLRNTISNNMGSTTYTSFCCRDTLTNNGSYSASCSCRVHSGKRLWLRFWRRDTVRGYECTSIGSRPDSSLSMTILFARLRTLLRPTLLLNLFSSNGFFAFGGHVYKEPRKSCDTLQLLSIWSCATLFSFAGAGALEAVQRYRYLRRSCQERTLNYGSWQLNFFPPSSRFGYRTSPRCSICGWLKL